MYDDRVTESVAILAKAKGFAVAEPCTCGGFPDCICEEARRHSKRVYQPTQAILQRWIRDASGIEAFAVPVQVVEGMKSYFMYYAKVHYIDTVAKLVDNRAPETAYEKYELALETALLNALNQMPSMEAIIDLSRYRGNDANKSTTGRVFAGREFGSLVRAECGIDRFARLGIKATIQLPDDTFTVNPNFLEDLLEGAYNLLGEEQLRKQFTFACKSEFVINDNLNHALWRLEEKRRKKIV